MKIFEAKTASAEALPPETVNVTMDIARIADAGTRKAVVQAKRAVHDGRHARFNPLSHLDSWDICIVRENNAQPLAALSAPERPLLSLGC